MYFYIFAYRWYKNQFHLTHTHKIQKYSNTMYLPIYPFFMYWYTEVSIINDSVNDKALWEALRSQW